MGCTLRELPRGLSLLASGGSAIIALDTRVSGVTCASWVVCAELRVYRMMERVFESLISHVYGTKVWMARGV